MANDERASTAPHAHPLARVAAWMLLFGLVLAATHGLRPWRGTFRDAAERLALPAPARDVRSASFERDRRVALPEPRLRTEPVPYTSLPRDLVDATLATEDRRFWQHNGVDAAAFVRAGVADLAQGRTAQGGSTISMQLARNLYLTHERTLGRKLEEARLAMALERRYTKREILERYFGSIYYGEGATGVREAARRYYGKPLAALSLAECAMLAGIPANPTLYSPIDHPERAVLRREKVLRNMLDTGAITSAEYGRAMLEPVRPRR